MCVRMCVPEGGGEGDEHIGLLAALCTTHMTGRKII